MNIPLVIQCYAAILYILYAKISIIYVYTVPSNLSWNNSSRINGSYRIGAYINLGANTQYELRVVALYFTLVTRESTPIAVTTGGKDTYMHSFIVMNECKLMIIFICSLSHDVTRFQMLIKCYISYICFNSRDNWQTNAFLSASLVYRSSSGFRADSSHHYIGYSGNEKS